MKKLLPLIACLMLYSVVASAQSNAVLRFFPKGTQAYLNVPYANDTLIKHQLDIYLPAVDKTPHPIILWLHSGGWRAGDKQGDMHDLPRTLRALISGGYAIATINYRYSTTAIFPAQIRDCNQALTFIYENAAKYRLDSSRIAVIGFSAGGHLAALMGLSSNEVIPDFYPDNHKPHFKIRAVVDYFGLSNFYLIPASEYVKDSNGPGLLFGAAMNDKPKLVEQANPVHYIDAGDPPFLIVHGTKDEQMDVRQSLALNDSLRLHGMTPELMLVKSAPHGGKMFDTKFLSDAVISFLNKHVKN